MKKKLFTVALAVIIAVTAITGASLAYLKDTDAEKNTMTLGNVQIRLDEWMRNEDGSGLVEYVDPDRILPAVIYDENGKVTSAWGAAAYAEDTTKNYTVEGLDDSFHMPDRQRMRNVIDKIVTVTNTGYNDAYVRTIILIETTATDAKGTGDTVMPNLEMMYDSTLTWQPAGYVAIGNTYYYAIEFVYAEAIAKDETTLPSAMAFWMNPAAENDTVPTDFDIIAYAQAVQADGFDNAQDALDVAFGEVNEANLNSWVADYINARTNKATN